MAMMMWWWSYDDDDDDDDNNNSKEPEQSSKESCPKWILIARPSLHSMQRGKNALNADRIMKFLDENELNYIWTIRCDKSETVRDRISVLFGIGTLRTAQ